MKNNLLKSIALVSLVSTSIGFAQQLEPSEDWNASSTGVKGKWNVELSQEELKAAADMKAGGTTYWVFTGASGASPYQSGYTYNYGGAGCMNASGNGGTAWFDQNINIPDGHTITFMRFYYNDADAGDTVAANLMIMNGDGNFTTIETRTSDTDTGFDSVGASMSYPVDNTNGALIVRYGLKDSTQVEPCGVRFVVSSN